MLLHYNLYTILTLLHYYIYVYYIHMFIYTITVVTMTYIHDIRRHNLNNIFNDKITSMYYEHHDITLSLASTAETE